MSTTTVAAATGTGTPGDPGPAGDRAAGGYEYRTCWDGRDHAELAEERALRRSLPRLGHARWFADFGGGFGRHARQYRDHADRYVVIDRCATELSVAAQVLAADVASGRAQLVRADLHRLPFADTAFDAALLVRVLHELPNVELATAEMGRVVGGRWLLDVPVKNHLPGIAGRLAGGRWRSAFGRSPVPATGAEPGWQFHLGAVRALLAGQGWRTEVLASVHNLGRWDRLQPRRTGRALRPAALAVEGLGQRLGTGWWGPDQFVLAERPSAVDVTVPVRDAGSDVTTRVDPGTPALAAIACCPRCRGVLRWSAEAACCAGCAGRYPKVGGYWDLTVPAPA